MTTWFACSLDAVLASLLANRGAAPLPLHPARSIQPPSSPRPASPISYEHNESLKNYRAPKVRETTWYVSILCNPCGSAMVYINVFIMISFFVLIVFSVQRPSVSSAESSSDCRTSSIPSMSIFPMRRFGLTFPWKSLPPVISK